MEQKDQVHVVMQLKENPISQTDRNREYKKIHIEDRNGNHIQFALSDVQMVEMANGVVFIRGKNFDVFADPNGRNDREVVDCTVVDA